MQLYKVDFIHLSPKVSPILPSNSSNNDSYEDTFVSTNVSMKEDKKVADDSKVKEKEIGASSAPFEIDSDNVAIDSSDSEASIVVATNESYVTLDQKDDNFKMLTEIDMSYKPPTIISEIEKQQIEWKRAKDIKKEIEKFREEHGEQAGGGRPKGSTNKQHLNYDHMYLTVAQIYYENFDIFLDKTDRHADILQQQNKVWKDIENALNDEGVTFSAKNLRANFQKFVKTTIKKKQNEMNETGTAPTQYSAVEELILEYESTQQSFKSTEEEDLGAEDILQQLGRGKRQKKTAAVWTPASTKRNPTSTNKRKRDAHEAFESDEHEEDEEDEILQCDLSQSLPSRSTSATARNSNIPTSPITTSLSTPRASSSNSNKRNQTSIYKRKRNAYKAVEESEEDEDEVNDEEDDNMQADLNQSILSRSASATARNSNISTSPMISSLTTPRASFNNSFRSSVYHSSPRNSFSRRTNSGISHLFDLQSLPHSPRNSVHPSARNASGSNASSFSDLASQITKTTSGPAKKAKSKEYDELTEISRTVNSAAKAEHMRIMNKLEQDRETADTKKLALDQLMRQQAEKHAAELKRMEQQTAIEKLQLDTELERNRKAKADAEAAELQVQILQKQLQNQ